MTTAPQLKEALKYQIKIQGGPLSGKSFYFEQLSVKLGRDNENDLVLTNDLRASRQHAEIRWDGFELHIFNLSKKNFLIVNGSKVDQAKLDSGAIIEIGESELRIEFDQEAKTQVNYTEAAEPPPLPPAQSPQFLQPLQPPSPMVPPAPTYPPVGASSGFPAAPSNYATNIPGAMDRSRTQARPRVRSMRTSSNGGRFRFYIIVLVLGGAFYWLMTSNTVKKKELTFRSAEQIEQEIEASREEIKVFEARKERMSNLQYKRAQENYVRGFRDYKQGNYGRARESFQVALNLDPDNELAKRYYHLAKVKFDEQVKFHMLQGNRYRDKKNWRMCKSSYFNVMTMLNNNQDPIFKEAKQYYDQCSLAAEGRF